MKEKEGKSYRAGEATEGVCDVERQRGHKSKHFCFHLVQFISL